MNDLNNRTVSAFPISISTSLALESLFTGSLTPYDPSRIIPNLIDVSKYDQIWINIHTLYRNLFASTDKDTFFIASANEIANILQSEIEIITSIFYNEGADKCKPYFYTGDYSNISKNPAVKLRIEKTPYQLMLKTKFDDVKKLLDKQVEIHKFPNDKLINVSITSLIITHFPYDLLAHKHFSRLDLLESNTGVLKTRSKWFTKYYSVGERDLSNIPFMRKLYLVFGDKVMLQPMDIRLRRLICDIADQYNWTSLTTLDKVNLDLSLGVKEPYVNKFLRDLK